MKNLDTSKDNEDLSVEEIDCFICPISFEVMDDPVISPFSGRSFNRDAIKSWIDTKGRDPLTRAELKVEDLISNRDLKSAIETWKKMETNWQQKAKQQAARLKQVANHMSYNWVRAKASRMMTEKNVHVQRKHTRIFGDIPEVYKEEPFKYQLLKNARDFFVSCELDKAYENLSMLVKSFPADTWIKLRLISVSLQLGNQTNEGKYYDLAEALCRELIKITMTTTKQEQDTSQSSSTDLDDVVISAKLRLVWILNRKYARSEFQEIKYVNEGVSLCKEVLEVRQNSKAYRLLAKNLRNLGQDAEAKNCLILASKLDDDGENVSVLTDLGDLHKKDGEFDQAEQCYLGALQDENVIYFETIYQKLANLSFLRHRDCDRSDYTKKQEYIQKAIQYAKKSLEFYDKDAKVHTDLGFYLTRVFPRQYKEARQCYLKALAIDPHYEQARKNLQWVNDAISKNRNASSSSRHSHSSSSSMWNNSRSRGRGMDYNSRGYKPSYRR